MLNEGIALKDYLQNRYLTKLNVKFRVRDIDLQEGIGEHLGTYQEDDDECAESGRKCARRLYSRSGWLLPVQERDICFCWGQLNGVIGRFSNRGIGR